MFCPLRIYYIGGHFTGKTKLSRWTHKQYGLPMINETARAEMSKLEGTFDAVRSEINLTDDYQLSVMQAQIEAEQRFPYFVSDRAFDALAYTAEHATNFATVYSLAREQYLPTLHSPETVIFFVRPSKVIFQSASDGIREKLDWDGITRIDGMIKLILAQEGLSYWEISDPSMQSRVRLIRQVIDPRLVR